MSDVVTRVPAFDRGARIDGFRELREQAPGNLRVGFVEIRVRGSRGDFHEEIFVRTIRWETLGREGEHDDRF